MDEVLQRIEDSELEVATLAAERVVTTIAIYRDVSLQSLIESCLRNKDRVIRAIREGHGPSEEDMISESWIARKRVRAGIPIEDVLHAYRLSINILRQHFLIWADEVSLSESERLNAVTAMWEVTDAVTLRLAAVHREEEIELARSNERERLGFLQALLTDSNFSPELRVRCSGFGLPTTTQYRAIRARSIDPRDTAPQPIAVQAKVEPKTPYMFGMLEGDLVGVCATTPRFANGLTVGMGPFVDLTDIASSYSQATRTLEAGIAFGIEGPVSTESLSLRLAVASEHDVGDLLVRKYVAPVRTTGRFGELIIQSVHTYLTANRDASRAAEKLVIHPNTLRYRIRRFEKLTGADLTLDRSVTDVWWAFERDLLERTVSGEEANDSDSRRRVG